MKIFISGTGTGVGKTWVSAAIVQLALQHQQRPVYYKPVQTGTPYNQVPEDPAFIRTLSGATVPVHCRYSFEPPVAPAAADIHQSIDVNRITADIEQYEKDADCLIVEGAGGLMVPMTPTDLTIDLIKRWDTPVLLVAHAALGTINHTLLSVEALADRRITLCGLVINFYPKHTSLDPAIATLLQTIKPFLPDTLPIWLSYQADAAPRGGLDTVTTIDWQVLQNAASNRTSFV